MFFFSHQRSWKQATNKKLKNFCLRPSGLLLCTAKESLKKKCERKGKLNDDLRISVHLTRAKHGWSPLKKINRTQSLAIYQCLVAPQTNPRNFRKHFKRLRQTSSYRWTWLTGSENRNNKCVWFLICDMIGLQWSEKKSLIDRTGPYMVKNVVENLVKNQGFNVWFGHSSTKRHKSTGYGWILWR